MPKKVIVAISVALLISISAYAQGFDNFTKGHGRAVLKVIKKDIEKRYYDPAFHGINLEAHFKRAETKIDVATSTSQVFGIIAEAVLALNDSHTKFWPPERANRIEYGWQMQMIGDNCYVVAVKPGSDAEGKGLRIGDHLMSIDGFAPTQDIMWKMQYAYYTVRPQPGMRLAVQSPNGQQRQLDVMAKITLRQRKLSLLNNDIWKLIRDAQSESRLHRDRYHEVADDLIIWKMPEWDLSGGEVNRAMKKVNEFKSLILDLRGNGGGLVSMLERMAGHFFEQDLTIADLVGRKKMKPIKGKTQGKRVFKGNLVVLIDSESGSASEIFARVIQLEERGVLMGDRSAGAVMRSRYYGHQVGAGSTVIFYGTSITDADLVMSDGKSLENVGVIPDELVLPTAQDLASGRDPALSKAAASVGVEIDPTEAGALFPIEWRK
jgi:carboxyl-terminal processing protease